MKLLPVFLSVLLLFSCKNEQRVTGEEKSMSTCMPMGGEDMIKYYGNLEANSEENLSKILSTLKLE
ncbi:hypothetical protein GCM10007103_07330 [Salinimicrobium marinum]|uniref:Lipoprotein n=1 Tax=Salinimicrobium marinum TaxID=680283 RepID=A0A918S7H1_9FLAO|nr:hypothetical protein GCM10007103_07330 [Salinimicrobium marinum]